MRTVVVCALSALTLSACAHKVTPFPLAEPLWQDTDRQPLPESPDEYWSGLVWDGIDQLLFLPIERGLSLKVGEPAVNVNSWDEVPDSSWFVNRIGVRHMSLDEVHMGACTDDLLLDDPSIKWIVTGAKPNGLNPGFQMETTDGRRYLMKFDGLDQGPRATAADVIGSRLYWAAGYHAPCNQIAVFDRDRLTVDPEATWEDDWDHEHPLTWDDVERVLGKTYVMPDGQFRGSASAYVEGVPIGPWTYQGMRDDDANDVIPHEDRRDLRGSKLISAWLNHFDSREQNTLATFVSASDDDDDPSGHVRHYMLDFGDTLGSRWEVNDEMLSRRFGHSYYFDLADVIQDTLSLGIVQRPWDRVSTEDHPVWGAFDVEPFNVRKYKGGYTNSAFQRMNDEDGAWMARILGRFTDAHVHAAVEAAQLPEREWADELERILRGRRDKIVGEYLTSRTPLVDPVVDADRLCAVDLAHQNELYSTATYDATLYTASRSSPAWQGSATHRGDHGVCLDLSARTRPATQGPDDDPSRYLIVDLIARPTGEIPRPPLRLHLYDTADGLVLAGIERPESARAPRR